MVLQLRRLLFLLIFVSLPALGQVFNCSSFTTSNTSCGVGGLISGSGSAFKVIGTQNGATPAVSGGVVTIANSGISHFALSMMYQTAVNVQAFTTTFQFVPNNQNLAFTLNNCSNNGSSGYGTCGGFSLANFSSGASCEGGFSQAFSGNPFPYNVFALMFDNYGEIPAGGGTFGYSNVQIYQQNQSPCNPSSGGSFSSYTTKQSTSPVPLTSPATTQGTTTGDTYAATLNYDGSNLNLCLIDVTVGGSTCNSTGTGGTGTYFQYTWTNVSIPSQVDGTTAYMGFTASSGEASTGNVNVASWEYTANSATSSPGSTATSAGAPTATNPSFSPAAGSYASAQTVTITSSGSSNICYTLGSSGLVLTPIANQNGGCGVGTLYTGPVTISSSQTLYAVAGLNNTGLSSGVAQGVYTITGGSAASAPTFSPAAGTYIGSQSVTASTSSPGCSAYIYFDTNPTPTTNQTTLTVASNETVYAYVHNCPGYTDSTVSNATYSINAATPTFSPGAGSYGSAQTVTISTTFGTSIYYNTTGSPTCSSTLYSAPVTVSSSETLYAVACGSGINTSSVGSAAYTISTANTPRIAGKVVLSGKVAIK
jgi:hypothetical protein